ncbi:MAG: type IV toxin-antitoxin system AbiEi family antitoxin domain-containing protein [Candidatus Micrarchaeota archaeon]|nr:type IV toxin-antitoxin system AbiEi family antitoxin domain-containing protein [Candidatus Micrarchaeota archaeon]MDE1848274.1 type IV toxin-antitoxin system AbiEi family antitoxin domain-containing protein [Candidatus Micrarchaeota archaeon]MDE1864589.1 type IV toxin-antitoxin system AbiEi family antitoxin domain-containing protein [Candidatus Micrarchaeota archaeon]
MKYIGPIRKRFNNFDVPVFRRSELKLIKGLSDSYMKVLVHNLLARGEIKRITKGTYTFHDDADVVCFAFSPSYYGLEDALSIRRISEQGTNPVVVTLRNVRRGARNFGNKKYLVYHLDKSLFFGYDLVRRGDFWIPVSDLEKTLIDMAYFKVNIRNELWPEILANIDKKRLGKYLKKYDKKFQKLMHNLISEHGK